jgi:hypothetical protein
MRKIFVKHLLGQHLIFVNQDLWSLWNLGNFGISLAWQKLAVCSVQLGAA